MSRSFRAVAGGIRMSLSDPERELLVDLRDQLAAALAAPDPGDPAIKRLFPTPVLGDAQVEFEVRGPLVDALLEDRLTALDAVLELLERATWHRGNWRVLLRDDEPTLILQVLNDLRLAIGARIDIEALDRDAIAEDDPVVMRLALMDLLGWWQEQLLVVLDPSLADEPAHEGGGSGSDVAQPDGTDGDPGLT